MSKFGPMFEESVSLFKANLDEKALESFQSLLFLLEQERRKDSRMIQKVNGYIDIITRKTKDSQVSKEDTHAGFALLLEQPAPILLSKKSPYKRNSIHALNQLEQKANSHWNKQEYQVAANTYSKLGSLILGQCPEDVGFLAETYWNEGMCYSNLFEILKLTDPATAADHKEKVIKLITLARDTYPQNDHVNVNACKEFLLRARVSTLPSTVSKASAEETLSTGHAQFETAITSFLKAADTLEQSEKTRDYRTPLQHSIFSHCVNKPITTIEGRKVPSPKKDLLDRWKAAEQTHQSEKPYKKRF